MQFKFDAHMVAQIAFSPNGKYLAAVATDVNLASALRIHDIAEDKEHLRIGGATWGYRCITFTSDSKKIFASGHGNAQPMPHAIRGWSLDKGVELHVLQGYAEEVIALQMLEDDKTLASVHVDGTVRFWDLGKNQESRRWKSLAVKFAGIALARDGVTLAVTRDDNTVELWDAVAGVQIREIAKPKDRTAKLTFSPDGRLLVRVPNDGKSIQIYEAASGVIRHEIPRQVFSTSWSPLAISPDNSLLAFSDRTGRNNAGVLLRLSDGNVMMQDYAYWRYTVAFSDDGKRLAAGQGKTNWMNLWDLPAEKPGKEKALTDVQLESLWADLLDEKDGVKANRSIRSLIQAPSQTVPFVNKQLEKGPLDSPENDQRLRAARTVEVLERIGNRECRQILNRLAKSGTLASLRDDARRSERRLFLRSP
jgi:WD40 repeat protein